jgi:hypothetical protein
LRNQQWITWRDLELSDDHTDTQNSYANGLRRCNIFFIEEEDEILCSMNLMEGYVPRSGYKIISMEGINQHLIKWWKPLWKYKYQEK